VTERLLIKRCQQGDGKALKYLYERYADQMLGVCYRYVGNRDTARDLVHDGFVTVFTKIAGFRGEGAFEGWLRRIFVNTALGYLRKNANFNELHRIDELADDRECDNRIPDHILAGELIEMIGRMPDGYRTVLNLYAVEGYSHREIAELLNISENTSRSQYARAKASLRQSLKKYEMI
jgi:RNA polymerase sigma-70 factor (ECF subfamily)